MNPLRQFVVDECERATALAKPITDADVEREAIDHDVHPRTVVRCLAGLAVRGQAGVRARAAVERLRAGVSRANA